jgi:dihydrodipicolinate synthase/N-acetylneuraminate lyase
VHSLEAIRHSNAQTQSRNEAGASRLQVQKMTTTSESKARLKGVFNITVTPFIPGDGIDFRGLAENIERLLGLGFDGLLIGGTYGEFPAMSVEERATLFRRVFEIVRDRVPVLLCSAHSDPRVAFELTQLAAELGGIPMITAPFVSEVDDEHIVEFFRALAPASSSGLVIYNAPGIGITLSARLIERLSDMSHVIGLKQGDLNPTTIDELSNRLGGKIKLFCASDLAFLGPLSAGFDGLSSTNSCALSELILQCFRAMMAGDAHTATRLHSSWFEYRELARRFGQPQTVKAAMAYRGWAGGVVRPPLLAITSDQREKLDAVLDLILAPGERG